MAVMLASSLRYTHNVVRIQHPLHIHLLHLRDHEYKRAKQVIAKFVANSGHVLMRSDNCGSMRGWI